VTASTNDAARPTLPITCSRRPRRPSSNRNTITQQPYNQYRIGNHGRCSRSERRAVRADHEPRWRRGGARASAIGRSRSANTAVSRASPSPSTTDSSHNKSTHTTVCSTERVRRRQRSFVTHRLHTDEKRTWTGGSACAQLRTARPTAISATSSCMCLCARQRASQTRRSTTDDKNESVQ
jgi:hypothetical protein